MEDDLLPTISAVILLPESRSDVTRYVLIGDFKYAGFEVPSGFVTDGLTIPRIFWSILPPIHRYFPAAIIHDYLLTQVSRVEADREFKIVLKKLNISRVRRFLMAAAVRLYSTILKILNKS